MSAARQGGGQCGYCICELLTEELFAGMKGCPSEADEEELIPFTGGVLEAR